MDDFLDDVGVDGDCRRGGDEWASIGQSIEFEDPDALVGSRFSGLVLSRWGDRGGGEPMLKVEVARTIHGEWRWTRSDSSLADRLASTYIRRKDCYNM